ncbi:recombination mediator RecR [bacterium]|nr:recombination mediator RecR [bacterium]
MSPLPKALEVAIAELGKLPGIGRRSAERMAFALLQAEKAQVAELSDALVRLREEIGTCPTCGYFTDAGECPICSDRGRDRTALCVVERDLDVVAIERAGGFRGMYHVLGGVLSPLKGVTPEDLNIDMLFRRLDGGEFREVILATSPSVEGDATALYLSNLLADRALSVTRIGRGVPMGGSLDLSDAGTLRLALEGRRTID